jgi:hypothetical protein
VNKDERERSDCGSDDGVDHAVGHTSKHRNPRVNQVRHVLWAGTDEMNLLPISPDRFADEILEVAPILPILLGLSSGETA